MEKVRCVMERQMATDKTVFTTGQVAKICHVAPRTVSKWFDSGQLRGYRIPGSKDRRIPVDQLVRFMRVHGMPLDGLDDGTTRVLLLDGDPERARAVADALASDGSYDAYLAESAFEAGLVANEVTPHVILVDVSLADVVPESICRCLRLKPELSTTRLIGTAVGLSEARGAQLLQEGFDSYLAMPFEIRNLIRLIEEPAPQPTY